MENKKTTELLDLLQKLTDKNGNLGEGYDEAFEELELRAPFYEILHEDFENSLPSLCKEIEELKAEVKKLKRHKHDEKNGDVLIRI